MFWLLALLHHFSFVDFRVPEPSTQLSLPADHGRHEGFETEWWYLTGHLAECGSSASFVDTTKLGFQLTFFRRARAVANGGLVDGFLAHAAISKIGEQKFLHDSRSSALGASLAGAADKRLDLWNHEWFMREQGGRLLGEFRLGAQEKLRFIGPIPQPMLQGENGFSRKGSCTNCSSHYYSLPRISLEAELIDEHGDAQKLCGLGWLDHEWMSSAIQPVQFGWDWLSLMCKDGRNIMAFTVRGENPFSAWSFNDRRGTSNTSIFLPQKNWISPKTKGSYPIWTRVVTPDFEAEITPLLETQELSSESGGVSYWEGAVRSKDGCLGYLELTGYSGESPRI